MKKKKISEKYSGEELAESFVFRNQLSEKEQAKTAYDIAAARTKLRTKAGKNHSLRFKILQLKYQMEDCIQEPFNENYTFGYFLKTYIGALNLKRYQFAEEISIDETYLSQIINRHRSPSEEIIIRLELHSQNLIDALTWFRLLEKEKENEIDTNRSIREREKKYVKKAVGF
jgi:transcriptional regulator with XRE-family HTH domain